MYSNTTDTLVSYFNKQLQKLHYRASQIEGCASMKKNCNCKICATKDTYDKQIKQIEKRIIKRSF